MIVVMRFLNLWSVSSVSNRLQSIKVTNISSKEIQLRYYKDDKQWYLLRLRSLSTQNKKVRAKTGWFGIRMMCPSTATCLSFWVYLLKVIPERVMRNKFDIYVFICTVDSGGATKIQLSVMVWYKVDMIVISLKCNMFIPWYRRTMHH